MRPNMTDFSAGSSAVVRISPACADTPVVCAVRGEIDISNSDEFARSLTEAFRAGPAVVVDLSEVTFLASAGVRALFDVYLDQPERVMAVVTGPGVETILRICGMAGVLPCCPDHDAAVRACRTTAVDRD